MDNALFEARRGILRGMELTFAWRGYGSVYFLEFGALKYPPPIRGRLPRTPRGEIGVMLSWGWRIEHGNKIISGSWSDDDDWKPVFAGLIGRRVVDITVFSRLPELAIELTDDFHILTFMTVEDGPDWAIFERNIQGETDNTLSWRDGGFHVEINKASPDRRSHTKEAGQQSDSALSQP
jgi:hypothetical protein